jgi:hypothetical protein
MADDLEDRVKALEYNMDVLLWLHAELSHQLRAAAVRRAVKKLLPQLEQLITQRLIGAQSRGQLDHDLRGVLES